MSPWTAWTCTCTCAGAAAAAAAEGGGCVVVCAAAADGGACVVACGDDDVVGTIGAEEVVVACGDEDGATATATTTVSGTDTIHNNRMTPLTAKKRLFILF